MRTWTLSDGNFVAIVVLKFSAMVSDGVSIIYLFVDLALVTNFHRCNVHEIEFAFCTRIGVFNS